MSAPMIPTTAPVAAPGAPAATSGPVGLPATFGAPKIGNIGDGTASGNTGIDDEHYDRPLLLRVVEVETRMAKYELDEDGLPSKVQAPLVDYIALNPADGTFTERRGVSIMNKNQRRDILAAHASGSVWITGVATQQRGQHATPAKVLRPLDDTNSHYGVDAATEHLVGAARTTFGWLDTAS